MYCNFYQLRERPFNVTADPKFLYLNARYREALASLHYGITQRKGFVTLIGEAGTGKTTLLKKLLDDLDKTTRTVFVFNTNVTFDEILEYVFGEFDLPVHNGKRLYMLQRLNAFLLEELGKGRNVALLIDEAQDLSSSVLEDLRLLSNLETAKEKILQIVLSGQPELGEKLGSPALRQLRQRVAVNCRLLPLTRQEVSDYVQARLAAAGAADVKIFTPEAEARIFEISTGIPRIVNVVCDNALVIGYALGKKRVGADVIQEAAEDLLTVESEVKRVEPWGVVAPIAAAGPRQTRRWSVAAVVAVVAVALLIGLASVGRTLWRSDLKGVSEDVALPRPPREVVAPGMRDQLPPAGVSAPPVAQPAVGAGGGQEAGDVSGARLVPMPDSEASRSVEVVSAKVEEPPEDDVAAVPPGPAVAVFTSTPQAEAAVAEAPQQPAARAPVLIEPAKMAPGDAEAVGEAIEGSAPLAAVPAVVGFPEEPPEAVENFKLTAPEYRRVIVKPGDSVSRIVIDTYGQANATMLDLVKMANPSIRDIDVVPIGYELRVPQLDQGLAVLQEPNGRYALLVLSTPAEGRAREIGKALRKHGFDARVGRAHLGAGRVAWRVVVGDLPDRAGVQAVGRQLQRVVREDASLTAMADREPPGR